MKVYKELPQANQLKRIGSSMYGMVCQVSGWLGVTYVETEEVGEPVKYWCLKCNKWVDVNNDPLHKLQDRPFPVFKFTPKRGNQNGNKNKVNGESRKTAKDRA